MLSFSKTAKIIALAALVATVTARDDRCDGSEQQGICNAGFVLGCHLTCIEAGQSHDDRACRALNRKNERKTGASAPWAIDCTDTTTNPVTTTTPTTTSTTTDPDPCAFVSDIGAADNEYCFPGINGSQPIADRYGWNDRTYTIDTAPSDVLSGNFAYIRPNLVGPSSGCSEGGVSVSFAAEARVVIACQGADESYPIADDGTQEVGSWVAMDPSTTYFVGNTPQFIWMDFFEDTLPAGEATICCVDTWATGIFVQPSA